VIVEIEPAMYAALIIADYVNITCNGPANSQCNNWTIEPNGTKGGCATTDCLGSLKQNVAPLSQLVPGKGKSGSKTAVNQGDFYVAFSVGVTNLSMDFQLLKLILLGW
jgi:hypothetical protein